MLGIILLVLAAPLLIMWALNPGDRTRLQRNLGLVMAVCGVALWLFS